MGIDIAKIDKIKWKKKIFTVDCKKKKYLGHLQLEILVNWLYKRMNV